MREKQKQAGTKIRPYYVFQTILNMVDDVLPIQVSFLDTISSTHVLYSREDVENYMKKFSSGNPGVTFFKPINGRLCIDISPYGEFFPQEDMRDAYPPARALSEDDTREFVAKVLELNPLPAKVMSYESEE